MKNLDQVLTTMVSHHEVGLELYLCLVEDLVNKVFTHSVSLRLESGGKGSHDAFIVPSIGVHGGISEELQVSGWQSEPRAALGDPSGPMDRRGRPWASRDSNWDERSSVGHGSRHVLLLSKFLTIKLGRAFWKGFQGVVKMQWR
jgi:hypothetical protein